MHGPVTAESVRFSQSPVTAAADFDRGLNFKLTTEAHIVQLEQMLLQRPVTTEALTETSYSRGSYAYRDQLQQSLAVAEWLI